MEKYSDWRDKQTGIHPLLPPKNKIVSTIGNIIKYVIGPIFGLIRLPIVLILTLLLVLIDTITRLIPVSPVSKLLNRPFTRLISRLILFSMGFYRLNEWTETLRQHEKVQGSVSQVKLNSIVICNHTSYIDIIYLCYRFSPTFAVPPTMDQSSNTTDRLCRMSLTEALFNALFSPEKKYDSKESVDSAKLVEEICVQSWNGPLVVLPEGTTSNGMGLLQMPEFLNASGFKVAAKSTSIHLIGLTYQYSIYSPSYTCVKSWLVHLFNVCSHLSNHIEVKYLSQSSMPTRPSISDETSSSSIFSKNTNSEAITEYFSSIYKALSSLINTRRTQITSSQKISFVAYWKGYKLNKKTE
eukprot:gene10042-12311_t